MQTIVPRSVSWEHISKRSNLGLRCRIWVLRANGTNGQASTWPNRNACSHYGEMRQCLLISVRGAVEQSFERTEIGSSSPTTISMWTIRFRSSADNTVVEVLHSYGESCIERETNTCSTKRTTENQRL